MDEKAQAMRDALAARKVLSEAATDSPLEAMKAIVGGEVLAACVGHGTFVDLSIRPPGHESHTILLWVYLADWALLEGDEEIVASDLESSRFGEAKPRLGELEGAVVKAVDFLSADEAHIAFTGHRRLEIWRPEEGSEPGDALVRIFVDGHQVYNVVQFDAAAPPA